MEITDTAEIDVTENEEVSKVMRVPKHLIPAVKTIIEQDKNLVVKGKVALQEKARVLLKGGIFGVSKKDDNWILDHSISQPTPYGRLSMYSESFVDTFLYEGKHVVMDIHKCGDAYFINKVEFNRLFNK